MTLNAQLAYRLVLAIDIEQYSRRNAEQQCRAQIDLCGVLDLAAMQAGLDRGRWHRQDGGDGELACLPDDTDVLTAVSDFTCALGSALADLNRGRRADERLRVRLALHYGTLTAGPLGPAGNAPIVASRLVDFDAGRRHLRTHPEHSLAVIVSASLYDDVVKTGYCAMKPEDFDLVREVIKDTPYDGYLYRKQHGDNATRAPDRIRHGRRVRAGTRLAWDVAFRHRSTPSSN